MSRNIENARIRMQKCETEINNLLDDLAKVLMAKSQITKRT